MAIDPIIAEIHAIREAIARECNYDIRVIAQRARERQQASGRQSVSFAPAVCEDVPVASHAVSGSGNDNVIDAEFEKK